MDTKTDTNTADEMNLQKLTKLTHYFDKYDGEITTHHYKYRIVKLPKAIKEAFPNWFIFENCYSVDESKQYIHESDMKLHSFYSEEQHKNSMFGKFLANKIRLYIIRDAKDQYDPVLQIYESESGATSEIYLLHKITHYGFDNSKYYYLKQRQS